MDEKKYPLRKASNPPDVPQARSIENFWDILAQKIYEGEWKIIKQLCPIATEKRLTQILYRIS